MNEIIKDQIWTIDNFLSNKECTDFIKKINQKTDLVPFTQSGNFKNDKFINQKLATSFFDRVKKNINIPILRANNLIMTGNYDPGNEFGLHTDTGLYFDLLVMEKSNYTLLIYLNDDFEGGDTVFYNNNFKETVRIKPELGKALLFDISLWHQGLKILKGNKYWIGCEIISKFHDIH